MQPAFPSLPEPDIAYRKKYRMTWTMLLKAAFKLEIYGRGKGRGGKFVIDPFPK